MKNYISRGKELHVLAPYAVASGAPFMIGSLFLVASYAAASGAGVDGARVGEFTLPKLSTDVCAVGDKLNWNDTTKQLQKAAGDLAGVATVVAAAGNGISTVQVVLTPV